MHQQIDLEKTGRKLKMMLRLAGYDVKYVQEYLGLLYPQCIYRWFQGKILPSVDHLYALSILLGVHMEELLVQKGQSELCGLEKMIADPTQRRVFGYSIRLRNAS